jgi:hypothetical protein
MAKAGKGQAAKPAMVRKTIRLPEALSKRTDHYAIDADLDFQDVVAEALAEYLDRKGAKR